MKGKHGVWPLEKIAAIRLSYRPVSMQSRRFRADIEDTRGERVTIYSTTWHTVALMSPQDNGYRAFIVERVEYEKAMVRRLGLTLDG